MVPTYLLGVLVQCDPSIKAIVMRIDQQNQHSFVIEEIDDEHILVHAKKHDELKMRLKDVRRPATGCLLHCVTYCLPDAQGHCP